MKKIAIIGAGIVGSFLAYDLMHYKDVEVLLFDKHGDVAEETSKANSAIVHAGYDPEDHTLKALLNKRGADMYPTICKELHCAYQACGGYVLACNEEETQTLQMLYERGMRRHVRMEIKNREELLQAEPNLSDAVQSGLWVPDTAIITPWELCEALVEEALYNGLQLHLKEAIIAIHPYKNGYEIESEKDSYQVDLLINAAGLGAQKVMEMIEETSLFTITPKRGQYYVLSKKAGSFVSHVLYPAPSKVGKGVLALPTIHGNILLGPTSEVLLQPDVATTAKGLLEIQTKLKKTVKNVPYQEVIHSYSGCRPCGNQGDFYMKESSAHPGIYHLGCIDSPGLASAPAISSYVIDTFVKTKMPLKQKGQWQKLPAAVIMNALSAEERAAKIKEQKKYGHIICYCEQISEQEVIDCIHQACGAHSITGVKKRVRPGMGKCQGGYCEVEIAKILARELHIPLHAVCYDEDSYYQQVKEDVQ